jgi:squalene-hopene/tetraprenyl-beta-curcumene cyclase
MTHTLHLTRASLCLLAVAGSLAAIAPQALAQTAEPANAPVAELSNLARVTQAGQEADLTRIGESIAQQAAAYLRAQQHASGGWSVPNQAGQPHLPAITALALNGLLMEPSIKQDDPMVTKAVDYILSHVQPDGGIYDTILPSYNTAISISALARVKDERAAKVIPAAIEFLRRSQWGATIAEGASRAGGKEAPADGITRDHPFYGGLGYGNRGRPDISNVGFMLQAFADAGVASDDPAVQRALVFLQRCQMLEKNAAGAVVNDMPYAKGSQQGGFIYATGEGPQKLIGQSFAGNIDETLSTGETKSMLRAYGSVSYIGFKSYIYAQLPPNDPRVQAVLNWSQDNWTLIENPGIGTDGYYYYLLMFSRAMDASGITQQQVKIMPPRTSVTLQATASTSAPLSEATIKSVIGDAHKIQAVRTLHHKPGVVQVYLADDAATEALRKAGTFTRDGVTLTVLTQPAQTLATTPSGDGRIEVQWRRELIAALAELQEESGSFRTLDDRWMENNPHLTTSYSLIALQHALGRAKKTP